MNNEINIATPSNKSKLASFDEVVRCQHYLGELNPMDELILFSSPTNPLDLKDFRERLLRAINHESEEEKMERNGKVVAQFMEHCKDEGIEIPDSMYESYFNA